jgi:hypothetical protein
MHSLRTEGAQGVTEDWRTAWTSALDALEMDVAEAEAILVESHRAADVPPADPWQPPPNMGPLPLDLRPRADAILARQLAAAEAIAQRLTTNRQQSAVASRIETGEAVSRPAYLDCAM